MQFAAPHRMPPPATVRPGTVPAPATAVVLHQEILVKVPQIQVVEAIKEVPKGNPGATIKQVEKPVRVPVIETVEIVREVPVPRGCEPVHQQVVKHAVSLIIHEQEKVVEVAEKREVYLHEVVKEEPEVHIVELVTEVPRYDDPVPRYDYPQPPMPFDAPDPYPQPPMPFDAPYYVQDPYLQPPMPFDAPYYVQDPYLQPPMPRSAQMPGQPASSQPFEALISLKMTTSDDTLGIASVLSCHMKQLGIRTFFAPEQLGPGDQITSTCCQVAGTCNLFVALVSRKYAEATAARFSSYAEADVAVKRKKEGTLRHLLWVRLDELVDTPWAVANLGYRLEDVHHVDGRGWRNNPNNIPEGIVEYLQKYAAGLRG